MQRRHFLVGCLTLTGAGCLRLNGSDRLSLRPAFRLFHPSLAMLNKSDFDSCLNSTFQLQTTPDRTIPVELIEVAGFPSRQAGEGHAGREPFSLLFRGPKNLNVPQQMYRLSHPDIGSHEIFLVPIGPDAKGMRLEAVFG